MVIDNETKILLFDGSFKLAKNITSEDILINPKGNLIKPYMEKVNDVLFKIDVINGRSIICNKNTSFLILDKNNCRKPSKELKNANIIYSFPKKLDYLVVPSIDKIGDFTISKYKAWILGLALANGRFVSRYKNISSFTISYKYDICEFLKTNFPCASIRKNGKLITLTGTNIIDFFTLHIKSNGINRKLSTDIIWMNKLLQLEFIKGWFDNKYISKNGTLIGSANSNYVIESIIFILSRLCIPYSISNNKLVISGSNSYKITGLNNCNRKEYRNFDNNILFQVKNISELGNCEGVKLNVDGIIANGYPLFFNKEFNNLLLNTKCSVCNKNINLQESICSDCQNKKLEELSWVYEQNCHCCNKNIKNPYGSKKFCSDVCRRKVYNPLLFKNNGENLKGYVNKGFLSHPQEFIYNVIKNYLKIEVTYNDRTVIRNPSTNYPLELDIWIPDKKIAVEFDGKGHFDLKYVKELDIIKNEVCKLKNIRLIRISYKDDWKNSDWIIKKLGETLYDNI